MAKGPAPLDPQVVYKAIVRLGGARLGQIRIDLNVGRTAVATAIGKLAARGMIHKRGYA